MSSTPWYRFYSEALHDRKMAKAAKMAEVKKVELIGSWACVLSIASDSPDRGKLLVTLQERFTEQDIADELELSLDETEKLLKAFIHFEMIHIENGVYCVTNWQNRQFDSDISTDRVRKYREKQKRNVTVTPPDPDPDPNIDKEKELSERVSEMLSSWQSLFPKKPQPKPATYKAKIKVRLNDADFRDNWLKALELSSKSTTCQNESWFHFGFLVENDKNYQKMLNQWMDWKDKQAAGGQNEKVVTPETELERKRAALYGRPQ